MLFRSAPPSAESGGQPGDKDEGGDGGGGKERDPFDLGSV